MRKKIFVIVLFLFALFYGLKVQALTCKYGDTENIVVLKFDSLNAQVIINDKINTISEVRFDFKSMSDCPEYIYADSSFINIYDQPSGFTTKVLDLRDDGQTTKTQKVYCGNGEGTFKNIPKKIPELTSFAVDFIQVAIPIILIILGSIDLFKGITAGKEDEIKKGQKMFVKRLVIAALIFLVVIIVKFLISVVADTNATNIADCIDCFISNDCEEM